LEDKACSRTRSYHYAFMLCTLCKEHVNNISLSVSCNNVSKHTSLPPLNYGKRTMLSTKSRRPSLSLLKTTFWYTFWQLASLWRKDDVTIRLEVLQPGCWDICFASVRRFFRSNKEGNESALWYLS